MSQKLKKKHLIFHIWFLGRVSAYLYYSSLEHSTKDKKWVGWPL